MDYLAKYTQTYETTGSPYLKVYYPVKSELLQFFSDRNLTAIDVRNFVNRNIFQLQMNI